MTKKQVKPTLKKSLIQQVILLVAFIILSVIGLRFFMRAYTNHGQKVKVEDYREVPIKEAGKLVKKKGFKYAISDSTYDGKFPPGTVIEQVPNPGSIVKKKRTIYFIVNANTPPPIKMPDLIDNTKKMAELQLSNTGLRLGKITYRPDLAKDVVLEQQYNGKAISPGETINKGERIDLILGDGFGNTTMIVPNLVGLEYGEAIITLNDNGLSVGQLYKEGNITDLNKALVYEQSPASNSQNTLEKGQTVDLYVTGVE